MKLYLSSALSAAFAITTLLTACGGGSDGTPPPTATYVATILASDGTDVAAPNTESDLKNGWGVAFGATSTAWVSSNGEQRALLFDGNGVPQSLVVAMPTGSRGAAGPTGIVFNASTTDFQITANGNTSSAAFLFATDAGTIAGWSPKVLPTDAVTAFDDGVGGAVYKGLTKASVNGSNSLLAADFHNAKIDVFDTSFNRLTTPGAFVDASVPTGFAPFGIQAVGSAIVVTYAKQNAAATAQVTGAGLGYVDIFGSDGSLLGHLKSSNGFNAPWGVALAPSNFGTFSGDLLIGNFGDGTIDVFDPVSYAYLGKLTVAGGSNFQQAGLWGMAFGNGSHDQPTNALFYAAGPHGKADGVFGRLDVSTDN